PSPIVVLVAWLCGAIPIANLAARRLRKVDLRDVGPGTVSGTSLYRVAGFKPLAAAGILEIAKGAAGPLLAGRDRPPLAAADGGQAAGGQPARRRRPRPRVPQPAHLRP